MRHTHQGGIRAALLVLLAGIALVLACTGPAGPVGQQGTAGQPCTVTDNGNGTATITCPDGSSTTLSNGQPGTPGAAGTSCSVQANPDAGTKTITCTDGTSVVVRDGTSGTDGQNGGNAEITNFHGSGMLAADELATEGKYFANATITSATADANGVVTVDFTVKDTANKDLSGLRGFNFNIAKLMPPSNGESFSRWEPYIYRSQVVSGSDGGSWPNPDGTAANQASRESNGTLTDNGDGSYTYVFAKRLNAATLPVGGGAISYDRTRPHRVTMMMGGHSGPTATAHFDFVPDGSPAPLTRDIVQTSTCKQCHGEEFHGHGGDRISVENCVTCHAPGSWDPQGGETVDFKVMIHKIHAGGELASIPGPDGIVWDNPATTVNEAADNGRYAIWGSGNSKHEWWKVEFPAIIENCTKCHQGTGANVDNWKTVPSRAACGSCHDTVDFATGTNHKGGAQANDNNCALCHPSSGAINPPAIYPVPAAHDWTKKDPRNIPEFTVEMSVSTPANGTHFVTGEAPVVTIVLKDPATGTPIDHTTVVTDTDGAEGCLTTGCPAADGKLAASSFFVHGPRAKRNPVLTTRARVAVMSPTTGPWDISAANASLVLKVDNGEDVWSTVPGLTSNVLAGTVTVPVSSGTFTSKAAATAQEIVAWLNGNTAFKARAIAYLSNGRVTIRSRNLGRVFALQLQSSVVTTQVFADDMAIKVVGSASNSLAQQALPANNDPKATWSAEGITYQLDPVDDLKPGTYMASVELSDRGRVSATNYRTPSVAKVTFQVGTAAAEKPVANNCDSCHQGPDGKGFVLDFARHYKIFDDTAVDQCGACHDYQPQTATGEWSSGHPIAKRVHAVHFGSQLNYPLSTVAYSNGDPVLGRNWDITFPQDVRNCETCHGPGTSGTWKTKASRLPCAGCHDSDAARGHMKAMTWDPTPADPWSGDEGESCQACH